jgi:hypothetical protein
MDPSPWIWPTLNAKVLVATQFVTKIATQFATKEQLKDLTHIL